MDRQLKALNAVISSQLTVEFIEELQGTTMYKQNIKNIGNRFIKTLEPIFKQYDNVYEEDPELCTNVSSELEKIIKKLSRLDIREITMLNQIHDHYKNNQSDWDNLFDVELTKFKE